MVSKSGALGAASPSLVEGGVGSGVAGRDLSVMVEGNGEGKGEPDNLGDASRLSFRGGRRLLFCDDSARLLGVPLRAAAASYSYPAQNWRKPRLHSVVRLVQPEKIHTLS